jgi:hypothetical protein
MKFDIEIRLQAVFHLSCVGTVISLTIQLLFAGDTEFDMEKFRSEEYQRTFQYLTQFANGSNLDKFSFIYDPCVIIGDPVDALKIIIK